MHQGIAFLSGALTCALTVFSLGMVSQDPAAPAAQDAPAAPAGMPSADDMAAMMKTAQKFTEPGENHRVLERFLGRWKTETRITMPGFEAPPETGVVEYSWLMKGRWLQSESQGNFMGMPTQGFSIMGYDNFKMSFVTCTVKSMDTAMLTSEGDLDPSGKALITYGAMDEYLTGEHDKMVKYVWRFISDSEILFEVHDLPIGEQHSQVMEVRFRRT